MAVTFKLPHGQDGMKKRQFSTRTDSVSSLDSDSSSEHANTISNMSPSTNSNMTNNSHKVATNAKNASQSSSEISSISHTLRYLQSVANNSSDLPLSERDGVAMEGTFFLPSYGEEFAVKAHAFIPADVKILCGRFTGSNGLLPTREFLGLESKTMEPGLSRGGACCNALISAIIRSQEKVEPSLLDIMTSETAETNTPFDEMEDDMERATVDTAGYTYDRTMYSFNPSMNSVRSSNESQRNGFHAIHANGPRTTTNHSPPLTWVELLRNMKMEMQSQGYSQVPAITTSTRFDLNKPFTLYPKQFKPGINKKRCLLIGCNYSEDYGECNVLSDEDDDNTVGLNGGNGIELRGCHNDVLAMKNYLIHNEGFSESDDVMTVLMDDEDHRHPTYNNILEAFKKLAMRSEPGDAVFVLFSGHGCRVSTPDSGNYDEVIIPTDYKQMSVIPDTMIFQTLLAPMKRGVTVTCIIDSCHTGVMVDLPFLWSTKHDKADRVVKLSRNKDFSFVRFLKAVQAMYESSVFTLTGQAVRSDLEKHQPKNKQVVIEKTAAEVRKEICLPPSPVAEKGLKGDGGASTRSNLGTLASGASMASSHNSMESSLCAFGEMLGCLFGGFGDSLAAIVEQDEEEASLGETTFSDYSGSSCHSFCSSSWNSPGEIFDFDWQ